MHTYVHTVIQGITVNVFLWGCVCVCVHAFFPLRFSVSSKFLTLIRCYFCSQEKKQGFFGLFEKKCGKCKEENSNLILTTQN